MDKNTENRPKRPQGRPKNDQERAERKRWIINQIRSGVTQTELAAELGVSRQAVSIIWKDYQKRGEAIFHPRKRGKPKETDTLTPKEVSEFVEWLRNNPPESIGATETRWTLRGVKRAIAKRLKKHVRIEIAHAVYRKAFPLPEGAAPGSELSKPQKAPPAEPATGTVEAEMPEAVEAAASGWSLDPGNHGLPSLEEMEQINRETAPEFSPGENYASVAAPGVRTGKHSKGKRTPRPKPKRRKKR